MIYPVIFTLRSVGVREAWQNLVLNVMCIHRLARLQRKTFPFERSLHARMLATCLSAVDIHVGGMWSLPIARKFLTLRRVPIPPH